MKKMMKQSRFGPVIEKNEIAIKPVTKQVGKILRPIQHPKYYKSRLNLSTINEADEIADKLNQSLKDMGTFGDIVETSRLELLDGYIDPKSKRNSIFSHSDPDKWSPDEPNLQPVAPMLIRYQTFTKKASKETIFKTVNKRKSQAITSEKLMNKADERE